MNLKVGPVVTGIKCIQYVAYARIGYFTIQGILKRRLFRNHVMAFVLRTNKKICQRWSMPRLAALPF